MRRQVITGGAIVVISVASAAAYGIVQGNWFHSARQQTTAPVEVSSTALAPHMEGTETASAWFAQGGGAPENSDAAPAAADAASSLHSAAAGQQQPTVVAQLPAVTRSVGEAPNQAANQGAGNPQPSPQQQPPKPAYACANPNAMGVSRVVQIDTTGGPGFGSQHFRSFDFLHDHEVVLTFDDGPWVTTPAVLKALADQCLRATFFPIGKHSTYHPDILRQVIAAGHTVGSHTWSHADLVSVMKKSGQDAATEEIEKGISAVHMMGGNVPLAPFFRFPALRHPPEMVTYLGGRNVAIFSADIDSLDFKIKKPEELLRTLVAKVIKAGKGIILMHDFQRATSIALPQILGELQKNGFKVVHMVAKGTLSTLPQFDEAISKDNKLPTVSDSRPTESVVRTISGE